MYFRGHLAHAPSYATRKRTSFSLGQSARATLNTDACMQRQAGGKEGNRDTENTQTSQWAGYVVGASYVLLFTVWRALWKALVPSVGIGELMEVLDAE